MYRVYVIKQRRGSSEVLPDTRTQTGSFAVACAAFWELYEQQHDETHLLLMSKNNRQVNAHRYRSQPGDRDYVERSAPLSQ